MKATRGDRALKITEFDLMKVNRCNARTYYLELLDEVITRLIIAEDEIYDEEVSEHYTSDDIYNIVKESIHELKKVKVNKLKDITLTEYIEQREDEIA